MYPVRNLPLVVNLIDLTLIMFWTVCDVCSQDDFEAFDW
jgi:hypothetical protein